MAMVLGASSSSDVRCSICWEDVSVSSGRSIVRLTCSHLFHLDCIGSAFNASGVMQCPNCRVVEHGAWRRFAGENSHEESMYHEINEDDHQFIDMQPRGQQQPRELHLCPFHGGNGMLPSNGSQNIVEQPVVLARNHNVNHWPGQNVLTQISATHFVHNHYVGQPAMFTSMSNHITGPNLASIASDPFRDAHNNPELDGIPNLESVGHWVILQHGNGPVYDNIQHVQALGNSASPVVRASMLCVRNGSNGLPGGLPAGHAASLPEQSANFYRVPSLTLCIQNPSLSLSTPNPSLSLSTHNHPQAAFPSLSLSTPNHPQAAFPSLSLSTPNHPQAAFLVHHHVQERGPFAPSEHLPDGMGPSWGMFN